MLSGTFSARAYAFFDTLLWIAGLNLLWIAVTPALVLNWNYFAGSGGIFARSMAAAVLAAAIFLAGAVCYLFPMYARYELPLPQYLLMSSRFAVRHLAGTVILLFVSAAVVYASSCLPGLVPFFSIGAWLYLTGWLCDRFFAANDESAAAAGEPAAGSTLQG